MDKEWESFNELVTGPAHYSTEASSIKAPEKPKPVVVVKRIEQPVDNDDCRSMDEILRDDPSSWNHLEIPLGEKIDK